jgi:hypothetical protein
MKQEGSTGGFEQASADAEKLAAELAEIRKQLTTLREQNATFLSTDPVTGAAPAAAPAAKERTKGAPAPAPADASAAAVSQRLKEPEMAGAQRAQRAGAQRASAAPAAEPPKTDAGSQGGEPEQGKRKWWRKQKSAEGNAEGKQSSF